MCELDRIGVVSVVTSVNLTCNGQGISACRDLLEVEECARTIGEEGITRVGVLTCSHIGEYLYAGKLIESFVETNSVCGKSYAHSVLVERVLKSHLEQRRILVLALILSVHMVLIEFLVRVVGAIGLDSLLYSCYLYGSSCGVENVYRHLFGYGVNLLHIFSFFCTRCRGCVKQGIEDLGLRVVKVLLSAVILNCLKHYVKDLGFESRLLYLTGNEHSRLLTSDSVLYSDTVLYILYSYLAGRIRCFIRLTLNGFRKAVEYVFVTRCSVGVSYDDLREQLLLDSIRRIVTTYSIGVREKCFSGCDTIGCYLSAISVYVKTVAVLLKAKVHRCQLILCRINRNGNVVIGNFLGFGEKLTLEVVHRRLCVRGVIGILRCCVLGFTLSAHRYNECAHKHNHSQEKRYYSFC